jgi:hypothetical protein
MQTATLTRDPAPASTPAACDDTLTLRDDERQRCEVWTRVMGYHRPVASFNIGKQGEFRERQYFAAPCPSSN